MTCRRDWHGSLLPTMYLPGVLFATLFVIVLAESGQSQPSGQKSPLGDILFNDKSPHGDLSRYCFIAGTPSATCHLRCHLLNMVATCIGTDAEIEQSGEGKCVCVPRESEPESTEEDSDSIFINPETRKEKEAEKAKKQAEGKKTSQEETPFTIPIHKALQEPEEDQNQHHVVFYVFDLNKIFGPVANETKTEEAKPERPSHKVAPAGWTMQHYIAFIIIALLVALIGIELFTCYRKQRAATDMDSIFKNIPMPDKA